MDVIIRPVKKTDLDNFSHLANDEWAMKISLMASSFVNCDGEIVRCYVAEESGNLIGFIYGFVLPNETLLPELLYVYPSYRKKGIGKQLLSYLEEVSGCSCSMIFYNSTLRDYYAKCGYMVGEELEVAMKPLNKA